MSSTPRRNGEILKLGNAPLPPRQSEISPWQANMRRAFIAAATPETTARVVESLARQAEAGDLAATKLYLSYAVGMPSAADVVEIAQSAEFVLRCDSLPGTDDKFDVMTERAIRGEPLRDPRDPKRNLD